MLYSLARALRKCCAFHCNDVLLQLRLGSAGFPWYCLLHQHIAVNQNQEFEGEATPLRQYE